MGAAQGVEARLHAGGVGGGDARAALGAHGGVWRGRRARAAQGALRWLRGGEKGARRRRLSVQASGGVSVGERRGVVAVRRRVRSGGGVRWEESGETEKERETDGPHKTHI